MLEVNASEEFITKKWSVRNHMPVWLSSKSELAATEKPAEEEAGRGQVKKSHNWLPVN